MCCIIQTQRTSWSPRVGVCVLKKCVWPYVLTYMFIYCSYVHFKLEERFITMAFSTYYFLCCGLFPSGIAAANCSQKHIVIVPKLWKVWAWAVQRNKKREELWWWALAKQCKWPLVTTNVKMMLSHQPLHFNHPFDTGTSYGSAVFFLLMQAKSQLSASLFAAAVLRPFCNFISNEQGL